MDVPISLAILLATGMSLYQTMLGSEQVYFDAAVSLLFFLLVGRFLDESLRVRARGEAQNLLSLQSGIATLIEADGARRKVAGACAAARRSPARRGGRTGRRRRRGAGREGADRSEPDHRRDGAGRAVTAGARGLCRHAQSRPSRSQIEVTRRRQRDAARRDQPADAGGRAGQGALSQARRPRGADLCARRARAWACDLPRLADARARHGRRR